MIKLYVQYGCGFRAPEGWLNFDSSPTLSAERLPLIGRLVRKNATRFPANVLPGDITRGPLVPPNSCDGIYASHVIEHMTYEDGKRALKNTFLMLRRNGLFRVVVPDLRVLAERYVHDDSAGAAEQFLTESGLGKVRRRPGVIGRLSEIFGGSSHLWMWDYASLSAELKSIGFTNVRRCNYGDCADPHFELVEDPSRFVDAVAIECRKP